MGRPCTAPAIASSLPLHPKPPTPSTPPPTPPQAVARGSVPLPLDAALLTARETARELLQRGLTFTFLAAWLTDRCFEAGLDDVVALPAWLAPVMSAGPLVVGVDGGAAAALMGGAVGEVAPGSVGAYLPDVVRALVACGATLASTPTMVASARGVGLSVVANMAVTAARQPTGGPSDGACGWVGVGGGAGLGWGG